MRKVLLNKYKYTIKDFFRWIGIILIHFLSFYAFIAVVLAFRLIFKDDYFPTISAHYYWMLYPTIIGPFVGAILHIIYSEKGITNLKAMLWIHSLIVVILLTVGISLS